MRITNTLLTAIVDKRTLVAAVALACMSGCVTLAEEDETDQHVHAPGCGHQVAGLTVPYYIPEQSLRLPKHAIPHGDHIPPLPGTGDVVYAKHNRFPVRTEFRHMPPHDAGAAYDIDGNQHVLVRSGTSNVPNGWEENRLGTRPHYRDPECFHPPTGLAPGMIDRCGDLELEPPPKPPQHAGVERVIRQPFSGPAATDKAMDLADQMGGAPAKDMSADKRYQEALRLSREMNAPQPPGDLPYCGPDQNDGCLLPK